ncbi:hypothetical protein [Blastochloris tepida]|uniref:Uncharacterized protein n=1 Tax=Blastochloris tepida TaxID=2233851 RepID=A0A348FZA6_9HYPH|nr:hypothetical protein [Blastochloris tepida]BBF92639.1 hypothetical protein BLTE_13240 [Blastochloris tepida]
MLTLNKLKIINDALISTGNNGVQVEYDGSDEWVAADVAFEGALAWTLERHPWKFAKATSVMARLPSSPDPRWDYAHARPADCLHIEAILSGTALVTDYAIFGDAICANFAEPLTAVYIRNPGDDKWPAGFVEALSVSIESRLYRALNEDPDEARRRARDAEEILAAVRTRSDQEEPRRAMFVSNLLRHRRGHGRRA